MRLFHLANHASRNIGNAALVLGLERVLVEDFAETPTFVREPWDLYSQGYRRFDRAFVDLVNRESDALLVGAAVSFDGRPIYPETGFKFDLPLSLWDEISVPIVFYGLSYRLWPEQAFHFRDRARDAIRHALASDRILFSVRGDGTKEWLENLVGLGDDSGIVEVPDPALYVTVEDSAHPELAEGKTNVVIALNAEDAVHRFGAPRVERIGRLLRGRVSNARAEWAYRRFSGWEEHYDAVLKGIADALARLAKESDLNVILAVHVPSDTWMTARLLMLLPEELKQSTVIAPIGLPTEHGPYFYDLYAKADAAVSMRIHAMNPAVGLGTPVVPIVSQDRMESFMNVAGLRDLCVDLFDPNLSESLHRALRRAITNGPEVRAALRQAVGGLRDKTRAFNRKVEEFLNQ